jgi:hypothetical protein
MRRALTFLLKGVFLFAFCWSSLATAYAGPATTYVDDSECVFANCGIANPWLPPAQPITTYESIATDFYTGSSFATFQPNPAEFLFEFSALVPDFEESIGCSQGRCVYDWGGDLNGGPIGITVEILFPDGSTQTLTFAGVVNSGFFFADYAIGLPDCPFGCGIQDVSAGFSGQWSNGWRSTGTINMSAELNLAVSTGTLGLITQTPEPVSLCLFGSGILGLGAVLRRKQALGCRKNKLSNSPLRTVI